LLEKDPQAAKFPYIPGIVAAWDAGYDAMLRGAPAVVVASAPKEDLNGTVNLTLALSYLELAAPSMGLGTCWAGLLKGALLGWPPLQKAIGLPENHTHFYPMMLGYPKANYLEVGFLSAISKIAVIFEDREKKFQRRSKVRNA
jgi:nitroreductase